MKRYILAVTGASGMAYADTLYRRLADLAETETHVIISEAARAVMHFEAASGTAFSAPQERLYSEKDLAAPMAGGSWIHQGMVICPCSMATLAAVGNGLGSNLIHRAADVTLKERRPLILVPRETPLNQIHLQNMLSASRAGATILPASPGFYHRPRTVQDLVNHIVGRILDHLHIDNALFPRWGEG